ncbi:hypothetical protein KFZ70_14355 [Tamlana fucoidanivorans]|uniref:Porin family protein n=1 Tax=Allotamlana fucoidanivorans TaxID=2583814 RepID=A0A5C4SRI3_9FLAO|nr:hypothetical protein [Tamlana fucoidanivorans]TNJ46610.1 hypothetical protein FGF67_02965 [Tamlana fucoidanivorans]
MKKLFVLSLIVFGFTLTTNAQEISKNALGLRLGDSDGFGAEVSWQHALGGNNRLEVDLGWRDSRNYDGFKLTGLYQWVWLLDGNFNWYAGAGGGLGSYSFEDKFGYRSSDTFVFLAGDIGIEYNFNIPLLLSLDFRPEIGFGDETYNNNDLDFDIALGIRFQF